MLITIICLWYVDHVGYLVVFIAYMFHFSPTLQYDINKYLKNILSPNEFENLMSEIK